MLKSEIEAEECEKKAKEEFKNKNYQIASDYFEKAKKIYLELNYSGKVNVIEKQLAQIKRVVDYEKRMGKRQSGEYIVKSEHKIAATKGNAGLKNHLNKIQPIDNNTGSEREEVLSKAELRRRKIRKQIEQKEKRVELEKISQEKIKKREKLKQLEHTQNQEMTKTKKIKEKEKDQLIQNADRAMDQAKLAIENKEFKNAKKFYKDAIDIFKNLGWLDQADILYQEIRHVDIYESDYLKKMQKEKAVRQQQEEHFEKQINRALEEKRLLEQEKIAIMKKVPPEIKRRVEKIYMLKEKAQKEIEFKKYQIAKGRYEYILELYNSIPKDRIDFTNDISEIKRKISEIESKM